MNNPLIGTCSWNYDSWVGLVYTRKCPTAAEYLKEYSQKYRTAEIDSWFYRIPLRKEAESYRDQVVGDFRFTCKVSSQISLTHLRNFKNPGPLQVNPDFLSPGLFREYLRAAEPLNSQIDAYMLEFEYLNREKMPSQDMFLRSLDVFLTGIPEEVPLAVETRNKNYLNREYFQFLKEKNIIHVFSEKLYMPPVYEVYEKFGDLLSGSSVIRLLGGDRAAMEKQAGNRWDKIIQPSKDLEPIARMALDLVERGFKVTINVNNHYEGSSPLTIEKLLPLF